MRKPQYIIALASLIGSMVAGCGTMMSGSEFIDTIPRSSQPRVSRLYNSPECQERLKGEGGMCESVSVDGAVTQRDILGKKVDDTYAVPIVTYEHVTTVLVRGDDGEMQRVFNYSTRNQPSVMGGFNETRFCDVSFGSVDDVFAPVEVTTSAEEAEIAGCIESALQNGTSFENPVKECLGFVDPDAQYAGKHPLNL